MTRSPLSLAVMTAMGVLFGFTALLIINSTFMMYDDEGYVVLSYQKFIQGERLYADIFSQYGPVPYLYNRCFTLLLNSPFTHGFGRALTAFHWTLAALFSCAATVALTRDRISGLIAGFAAFGLLWQFNSEPSHPGGLICFLLSVAIFCAISFDAKGRWHALAVTLGTAASLLLFIKINIGLFFMAGAGAALLLLTGWPSPARKAAILLAAAGLLSLPWALMWSRLGEADVMMLGAQFSIASAALLWIASADTTAPIPAKAWLSGIASFGVTTLLIGAVMALLGTGPAALIDGVLLAPIKHPAHFSIPLRWPASAWVLTLFTVPVCLAAGWQLRRHGSVSAWMRRLVVALRVGAAAVFIWKIEDWAAVEGVGAMITHGLALLAVFLIPLEGSKIPSGLILAALVACTQILHVYPVAGSQKGWSAFLLIPVLVAGLYAAWSHSPIRLKPLRWLPPLFLLAAAIPTLLLLRTGWQRYESCRPLALPGATDIRVPGPTRLLLRVLTLNAAVHGDMLFSRPGMFSYNIWSGLPTPTSQNATHWFWLLDQNRQQDIIERLRTAPHPVVISSRFLEEFLERINVPITGPLQDYLSTNYKSLFSISGFNFWVPNDSAAVPFGLVETFVSAAPPENEPPVFLQSHVVLSGRPAAVRLQLMEQPWTVIQDYTASARRITLEAVNTQGAPLAPPSPLDSTGDLHGLYRLRVYLDEGPGTAGLHRYVITVIDSEGGVLSESMFN